MTSPARIYLPPKQLRSFLEDILLKVGVEAECATLTAQGLWLTSLRGTDSHGVRLLPHYVAGLLGGRINPRPQMAFTRTGPTSGTFDADHGFGHAAGIRSMHEAVALAEEAGVGFVSVSNSNHCGALAYFGLEAAFRNMIGLAMTHATPKMRSPQSVRPFFGTNPLCVTAPMEGEEPFCFDSAPTLFSNNKIKQYAEDGRPLPNGVAADAHGNETTNPAISEMLLPIGDYKGFGLSMVVDIFCALLSGMPAGNEVSTMYGNSLSEKRRLGQFYGALRIDSFTDPNTFRRRLATTAAALRSEPQRDSGMRNVVPGDPEKETASTRLLTGIPVTNGDYLKFCKLGKDYACEIPQPLS